MFKSLRIEFILLVTFLVVMLVGTASILVVIDKRRYLFESLLKKGELFSKYTAKEIFRSYRSYYIYKRSDKLEEFKKIIEEIMDEMTQSLRAVDADAWEVAVASLQANQSAEKGGDAVKAAVKKWIA